MKARCTAVLLSTLTLAACQTTNDVAAVMSRSGGGGTGNVVEDAGTGVDDASPDVFSDSGGALTVLELEGDLETHDSTVLEADGVYYLFHTGPGIRIKTSNDLLTWADSGQVFDELPPWIPERLPDVTDLWAPDVSWFGGTYHLYYAASTFGSGRSCIGHATNEALDSGEPWVDRGFIVCSDVDREEDWDAIDPATLSDASGTRWMVFGSFGSGIKLIRLNAAGERDGDELYSLAARPVEHAVQAPFLLERAPYFYLFVSFDRCCRGTSSTYNIRVGRSQALEGPYVDRDGVPMLEGGGTLVLEGDERWRGVGANTILTTASGTYNVYHAYDANAAGRATLRIAELGWDDEGWPISAGP